MRPRSLRRSVGASLVLLIAAACGSTSGSGSAARVSPPANLLHAGKLTMGSDISYPPQEFKDESNHVTGFDYDIAVGLASQMGLQLDFQNQDFNTIIDALGAKKYDIIISAMTINDKRKEIVHFVPYFQAGEVLLVKKGTRAFKVLKDLCGARVAVQQGTAEADEIKTLDCSASTPPQVSTYPTDSEALQQLKKGSVDVEFTDSPVGAYDVKKDSDLEVTSAVLEIAPEGIAIRKDDTSTFNAIQAAFAALVADGTYDSLLKKWNLQDGDIRKAPAA